MRKIVACINVTLDGVMQGPGRPDEDRRGNFDRGGWAAPYEAMTEAGDVFGSAGALLLGRRTYEDFFKFWPAQKEQRFTPWLTKTQKYVVSRSLSSPLPWENSTLLKGDAEDSVSKLKNEGTKDILILGSGQLVRALTRAKLIDEYLLLIHPLVLGSGRHLFADDGTKAALKLESSKTTAKGVIIAKYVLE